MNARGWIARAACAFAVASCLPAPAWSQVYPSKPVRLVVGFAPGGPTDVIARAFAEHAGKALGQPFVVENRPGANAMLAAQAVAKAAPNGDTLLFAATNHTMIPALYGKRAEFDAVASFRPVCALAVSPTVLVVGPSMGVKSVAEFLQAARAAPGVRTVGSPGIGSSGHFEAVRFQRATGISLNHIPYKGAAPAVTDIVGGQLDSSFATLGSVLPQIQGRRVTALAIAAAKRTPLVPDTPTFAEGGIAGVEDEAWYGVLAPAATPAAVVDRLEQAARDFVASPEAARQMAQLGIDLRLRCGEPFRQQLRREVAANAELARQLDIKLE